MFFVALGSTGIRYKKDEPFLRIISGILQELGCRNKDRNDIKEKQK